METARRFMGLRYDGLYSQLDAGTVGPEEAIEEMVAAGVPEDVAARIAGEASGLVL